MHVTELRVAVNALRLAAGLTAFSFTDATPVDIRAVHIDELRTALAAARSAATVPTVPFTGAIAAGADVFASHFGEIADGLQ